MPNYINSIILPEFGTQAVLTVLYSTVSIFGCAMLCGCARHQEKRCRKIKIRQVLHLRYFNDNEHHISITMQKFFTCAILIFLHAYYVSLTHPYVLFLRCSNMRSPSLLENSTVFFQTNDGTLTAITQKHDILSSWCVFFDRGGLGKNDRAWRHKNKMTTPKNT